MTVEKQRFIENITTRETTV